MRCTEAAVLSFVQCSTMAKPDWLSKLSHEQYSCRFRGITFEDEAQTRMSEPVLAPHAYVLAVRDLGRCSSYFSEALGFDVEWV